MKRSFFLLLLLVGFIVMPAEAQRKAGRNGAAFLEVGVGAREVSLGSAVTSLSGDANQVFWNPAGAALKGDKQFSAAFSYTDWLAEIGAGALGFGYNLGSAGTVTLGIQYFGVSDIKANRQTGYTDPILQGLVTDPNTSETYNYNDIAVSLSYAKYVLDRLSLGATFKYINESIDGVSANAVAFDFGSIYDIGLLDWKIAARVNNLGSSMSFYNQNNPLPLTFAIGTMLYPVNKETVTWMLALDAVKPLDSQQQIWGGTELGFYNLFFIRGGYRFLYAGTSDNGTSTRDAIKTTIEGFSAGAGIQYEVSGFLLAIDYAYTQMDLLNNVHRFTLRFGK